MCGDEDGAEDPVAPVGTALDAAAAESCTGVDPEGDPAGTGEAGTGVSATVTDPPVLRPGDMK
jgi:hypothetical protein